MKEFFRLIQIIFSCVGGWFGYLLGGFDGFIYTLVVFVLFDYITGVAVAIVNKKLSSEVGFKGIFKKVLIFALVAVGNMVDVNIIKDGAAIRNVVIFFYLSNEGVSIIENAILLGLPVPEKLKDIMEQIKGGKNG